MDIKTDLGEMLGRIRFEYFNNVLEVTDLIHDLELGSKCREEQESDPTQSFPYQLDQQGNYWMDTIEKSLNGRKRTECGV